MVNVGQKSNTRRIAMASGRIEILPKTLALIESGTAKKGDVLGIARIAGDLGIYKVQGISINLS
jgi:cyclic pyranopterin monophosphate synthase